jgi:hypothetical protein
MALPRDPQPRAASAWRELEQPFEVRQHFFTLSHGDRLSLQ